MAEFGRVPENDMPRIMERIRTSTDLTASAQKADFVVEAVCEVPKIKREVFKQLDGICPESARKMRSWLTIPHR